MVLYGSSANLKLSRWLTVPSLKQKTYLLYRRKKTSTALPMVPLITNVGQTERAVWTETHSFPKWPLWARAVEKRGP